MFLKLVLRCGLFILLVVVPQQLEAADWTTHRRDFTNRNSTIDQPQLPLTDTGSFQSQYTSPVVVGDTVVTAKTVTSNNRQITAYRLSTLEPLWSFPLGSDVPSQLTIYKGTVYFGLFTKPMALALDITTGEKRWQTTLSDEFRVNFAPVVINSYVFIPGHWRLHRLGTNGQYHWNRLYDIRSSMATDSESLYFRVHHQKVIRLNPETGEEVWSYFTNTTAGTEPIVLRDTVYIGTNGVVHAIDKKSGVKRWSYGSGGILFGTIAAVGDRIIYSTNLGNIAALKADTGEVLWNTSLDPGTSSGSTPLFLVAGDTVLARANLADHALLNAVDGSIAKREVVVAPLAQFQAVAGERILVNELSGGAFFKTHVLTASSWTKGTLGDPAGTEKEIHPVVVIPGILGSWPVNGEWKIDPVLKVYDGLLDGLREAGYVDNSTLFTFPYDWHVSNKITGEILHSKIREIKEQTGAKKVDLVAHSMGGLAARSYIQGNTYENDVDDFIMLGVPNHGSLKAYLTWEAGEVGNDNADILFESILAYESIKRGYLFNTTQYIKSKMPSIRELLPIFDYISTDDLLLKYLPCSEIMYPCNNFLEEINTQVAIESLADKTKITNIQADNKLQNTYAKYLVEPSVGWEHGKPINYPLSTGIITAEGDDSVLLGSSDLGVGDSIIVQSKHLQIPTDATSHVIEKLSDKSVKNHTYSEPQNIAFLRVYSPVDMLLVDDQGRKLGTDPATGQLVNEIPNGYYTGNTTDEEYMVIPDVQEGEYTLSLKGTGSGTYAVETSLITDSGSDDMKESGAAVEGLTQNYSLTVIEDANIIIAHSDLEEAKPCDDSKKKRIEKILERLQKDVRPKKREKLEKKLRKVLEKCQKEIDKKKPKER